MDCLIIGCGLLLKLGLIGLFILRVCWVIIFVDFVLSKLVVLNKILCWKDGFVWDYLFLLNVFFVVFMVSVMFFVLFLVVVVMIFFVVGLIILKVLLEIELIKDLLI